ncbi:FecR domain-containing protein [Flavivirga abyssicola]|uniref:FecR family protein n=1 Tax=Flavivirga abyssicola TaxID=3063533 RepID=UPI0026DF4AE1|nr:FecR domain-containing protein [Flavivirga sp. MEBiC07777]WVK12632.1 FecR domain-containing protein [Flavivirga sp. MEBiC07777]
MEFKFILKKLENSLTEEENKSFTLWYNASPEHKKYFDNVKKNYRSDRLDLDLEKAWKELFAKLDKKSRKPSFTFYKYAAAVAVILISSGVFYLVNTRELDTKIITTIESPILPGTERAILTLENGEEIALEKGEKFQTDYISSNGENITYKNVTNSKKANIAYNYLSIPRGGEFFVTLSDGTKVWLNSESKLKYPVNFVSGDLRKVELLYGEAYFDVSSSVNHNGARFIVATQGQEIEVLGTEFNIKTYKSDHFIATTLIEGRVAITHTDSSVILKPSQQAIVTNKDSNIVINTVDVDNEIAWKNGFFSFEKQSLYEMLKTLSRWYDVTIVYEDEAKKDFMFSGVLKRTSNIKELLINIEKTERVVFEIEGKTIIVK